METAQKQRHSGVRVSGLDNKNLLEICSTARDVLTLANCRLMETAMLYLIDILSDFNVRRLNKSEIENPCSSYPVESKPGGVLSGGHECATCLCYTILKPCSEANVSLSKL